MADTSSARVPWRILCIDDEPDVLEILSTALGLKYEVVTASNGIEAIGMLDFCDADFVVCDVRMPRMDGFQTVEAIRKHPDYLDLPVFFLTAETGREMAQRGFASGANLYLTKPFDPMRVLQNIDYFLQAMQCRPRPKRMKPGEVQEKARAPRMPQAVSAPVEKALTPRVILVSAVASQARNVQAALLSRCECIVCADPSASLHQLFRYEPDILIINPAIPHFSGWGLVQLIHQNAQLRGLPILLLKDSTVPLDERLLPSITKFAPLPADPSDGQVVAAFEAVVSNPDFRPRPKTASLADLLAEEKRIGEAQAREAVRRSQVESVERERYRSIQTFIDQNFR